MNRIARGLLYAAVPVAALVLAALIGAVVVLVTGGHPLEVLQVMLRYNLSSPDSIAGILSRMTPLILSGLAVALSFRAGLFNIGVEGQYLMGAFTASLAGIYLAGLPAVLHLPLTVLAGMAGGVLWAWLPAELRVRRGVHEVISTIMLNFVSTALLLWLIGDVFLDPTQGGSTPRVRMSEIAPTARIPRIHGLAELLGIPLRPSTALDWFFPVALAVAAGVYLLLWRTPFGFELRAVGLNPQAARAAGIPVEATLRKAFLLSGALAGLVGMSDLLGYFGYLDIDFPRGYGFTGIAVALLGGNHPAGVVLAAFLFAFLQRGGLGVQALAGVPREVITVMEGVIILTMLITAAVAGRWLRRWERARLLAGQEGGRGPEGSAAPAAPGEEGQHAGA
ncbi:inner-membrane translocator [Thermaerobacter marianensis DSM 12885]|uniref:Inner-membrane translocator n=1 Tax=Thermaerobacter marianensis (strain ATCC 700841 / DSM 12885 / JCM 10246 / 7p75a) TaxID=644966 RepID=E6SM71_THEM7|nr:ABC transporter permease [Thermaerobacter marianensis]ADU51430.1 inner-membrane translocator [Thermaerobacter marianensis DSM 12885]